MERNATRRYWVKLLLHTLDAAGLQKVGIVGEPKTISERGHYEFAMYRMKVLPKSSIGEPVVIWAPAGQADVTKQERERQWPSR